jgi:Signal transduction histidine kinase
LEQRAVELGAANQELESEVLTRKRAEERIKASLKEKEVLLKEIHHRVKNNLQVISSLLDLQTEHVEDEKTLEMFNEAQNRVRSMALIHEILYQSEDLSKINFAEYVRDLGLFFSPILRS